MTELLRSVSEQVLAPGGVTLESLENVLNEALSPGIDTADLYFQSQISESWLVEDGILTEGSFNFDQGVGLRAISGEKTGFSYSNTINQESLKKLAHSARSIARMGHNGTLKILLLHQV